jgi:hypothetical protein
MKTLVLILAFGALGISPFLWSGSAEAQTQLPQKDNLCKELRLEVEGAETIDISTWPAARVLLGLFCAHQGDPGGYPGLVPTVPTEFPHGQIALVDQKPTDG